MLEAVLAVTIIFNCHKGTKSGSAASSTCREGFVQFLFCSYGGGLKHLGLIYIEIT